MVQQRDYSPGITTPKYFAPPAIQSLASVLMISKRIVGAADLLY
jgi:hypothetical protein